MLDEPTNHLDVGAVEWLENFLQSYEKSFVIISHDRYFLDRTCRKIIEIESGKAVSYKGNYSQFLVEREERREQQQREFENQQAYIAKNEDFIRRNLAGQKTKHGKIAPQDAGKNWRGLTPLSPTVQAEISSLKKVERAGSKCVDG